MPRQISKAEIKNLTVTTLFQAPEPQLMTVTSPNKGSPFSTPRPGATRFINKQNNKKHSATLTAPPSHFRARRCSPWLRPGGIHGNLQLPWRYRGCPGGTELPPRYTELYEPVGVDYILFTYLSCTRLHDVLLRCSVVAQPRQCTGARGE